MWSRLQLRHIRLLRTLSLRWQRRLIFAGGGLVVGLAGVGLAKASDGAQYAFHQLLRHYPYAAFPLTPVGFGVIAWVTRRLFPNTQGSGIPQAIAAHELQKPDERRHS